MSTPMMQQYSDAKSRHPEEILFFRMGDFYEMFYDDAKTVSRVLGLTLTSRGKGPKAVPMAGVPVHQRDTYVARLIKAGYKVAICEQVEDPKDAKGIVKREVTKVITAGTVMSETLLDEKEPNFLAGVFPADGKVGLAWVDLSTGAFETMDSTEARFGDEIARIAPAEVLLPESVVENNPGFAGRVHASAGEAVITPYLDWVFEKTTAERTLSEHFKTSGLAGFGLNGNESGASAAGALLHYLAETQRGSLDHISKISRFSSENTLRLDRATRISLELVETMREKERKGSLLHLLDRTRTAMGARLMKNWTLAPLRKLDDALRRQQGTAELVENPSMRENLQETLSDVADIERLIARISTGNCNARDLASLGSSLSSLPTLKAVLAAAESPILAELHDGFDVLEDVRELIGSSIVDSPPLTLHDGGIIREGYYAELDEIRSLRKEGKDWIARFQAREIERTGIKNLKVGFNRVFGYYIEITRANQDAVPPEYVRKQTLKNAERYITEPLKEYEEKVLNAEERANEIEYRIFTEIRDKTASETKRLQAASEKTALIDALASFAEIAVEHGYCRPELDDSDVLEINDGRHPVLDAQDPGGQFVPNDTHLDCEENRLMIITGPNMAGKSTYIRQVALLALMAQMGAYIPASSARIGVVDGIYTRVGASDEIHRGLSTFMVEMTETANILNNATERSLIILDEVGRGTSTFDGVSLAWAITEHLHTEIGCKTLFATHYHELVELSQTLEGVKNYNIAVREWKDEIVFLRKILPGGTDKSYGIHVARLAGIPKEVVERAGVILQNLENASLDGEDKPVFAPPKEGYKKRELQMSLFKTPAEKVLELMRKLDIDSMTPLEALNKLSELKREIDRENPK